jgi:hypothetical protein
MIASACRGSWNFSKYACMWGNEIADGFPKDDAGTDVLNSSRIFASSEKAGRTGYSESTMMTPSRKEWCSQSGASTFVTLTLPSRNGLRTGQGISTSPVVDMCSIRIFLNSLSLSRSSAIGDRLREERHELLDGPLLEERERRKVRGRRQDLGFLSCWCMENREREYLHDDESNGWKLLIL